MSMRLVSLASGEFFHIYNRGTDKREIFFDNADYHRFLEALYLCNSEKQINVRNVRKTHNSVFDFERNTLLVAIGAYCLMPNHFHILATPLVEGGLTKFMGKLGTSFSMYFNKRYDRNGALFQGKFKAEHADSDEYLKYLYAYIHLNPVKLIDPTWKTLGIKDSEKAYGYASTYKYSSLPDYLGQDREEKKILNPELFPGYFQTEASHKAELLDWLKYRDLSQVHN